MKEQRGAQVCSTNVSGIKRVSEETWRRKTKELLKGLTRGLKVVAMSEHSVFLIANFST